MVNTHYTWDMLAIFITLAAVVMIMILVWMAVYLVAAGINGARNAYSVGCPSSILPEVVGWLAPKEGETLLDIGCGYRRVLLAFERYYPRARALGVENNPAVYVVTKV